MTSASRLSISREEIRIAYAQGEEAVIELVETRFNALVARLEVLENQLKQDSQNSSKPPSSDGFSKRTKSLRSPSERPSGGQMGHPGSTLEWSSDPTHVEIHPVLSCQGCGKSLVNVPVNSWDNRQVHDLPVNTSRSDTASMRSEMLSQVWQAQSGHFSLNGEASGSIWG